MQATSAEEQKIKCIVWDLDDTLWSGTLAEGDVLRPRECAREVVRVLDERGILQSIASRNESSAAMAELRRQGLDQYFLHPQIHWGSKAESLARIARSLNIGLDTFAFVDDQPFEREEVHFVHPEVLCIDSANVESIPELDRMHPHFITDESRQRRSMYASEIDRRREEERFAGASEEFLAGLGMRMRIASATERDLRRAEELTIRTHQLNTTGYTFSYEELDALRRSPDHLLLCASLEDRFGPYGTIGLALIEQGEKAWVLKLLLTSCRVMARGVGTVLLNHVMRLAERASVPLRAEFVANDRNRVMLVALRFAGFREIGREGAVTILHNELEHIQDVPEYTTLELTG